MRICRAFLAVGVLQFMSAVLVAERLYPGYSPSTHYISDLGAAAAPTAALFNISAAALGIAGVAAAFCLRRAHPRGWPLLASASVGVVGVALFPEDAGLPHFISAFTAFICGAASTAVIGAEAGGVYRTLGVSLAALSTAALSLMAAGLETPLGAGCLERLVAYPILIFYMAYGFGGEETG
ncbi:DUF998 domain-containing protein [Pyrobaculum neutrophilum]|uniref:DUF998 domain-containing protein n=1 Tax=Pyrobaculum neutrophilum (strain DSM 2338 / JCM 9278 / NBRC 100436 / V24Sta) TaxID=444157 RepID=B1YB47_PYRNV|nr:DUF998 domain-containing protein [Pyrobaculum neutrophilum]ACB40747.1 protein of unknown function DUF998 [Pyrobaculum neutrophilum V24Sta]